MLIFFVNTTNCMCSLIICTSNVYPHLSCFIDVNCWFDEFCCFDEFCRFFLIFVNSTNHVDSHYFIIWITKQWINCIQYDILYWTHQASLIQKMYRYEMCYTLNVIEMYFIFRNGVPNVERHTVFIKFAVPFWFETQQKYF